MTSTRSRFAGLLALVALAAGCQGDANGLAPVSGVLTVSAKPVPNGTVTFYPDASKGNTSPHQPCGVLSADGRFTLSVPGGNSGAPPGWYKVVVYAVDNPQPGKPNKYWAAKKYADIATTPLSVEVIDKPEPGRYDRSLDK